VTVLHYTDTIDLCSGCWSCHSDVFKWNYSMQAIKLPWAFFL